MSNQLNDDPLCGGGKDFFGHDQLALKVASLFERRATAPPNLAIYGPWGSGKSSLLYLAETKLKEATADDRCAPLWFNFDAWAYQSEDSLILNMLKSLYAYSKAPNAFKDSMWKIILASTLSLADLALKVASDGKTGISEIEANLKRVEGPDLFQSKHLVIKQEFEKIMKELSIPQADDCRKVILAIDNLDRCKPETAISLLETLFLISNIPNCTLVIAVDQHVLISFLSRHYEGTNFTGARYLEKIFPVSYRIPDPWVCWIFDDAVNSVLPNADHDSPPDQVYAFLDDLLKGTHWDDRGTLDGNGPADEEGIFATVWHYLSQPRILRNPRRIKRIIRFIRAYKPEDQHDAEIVIFLVILSDLWPDALEFLLSVDDTVWTSWVDYLATGTGTVDRNWILLGDISLRDFMVQIRNFYEIGSDQNTFAEACPIRQADKLFDSLVKIRSLGL